MTDTELQPGDGSQPLSPVKQTVPGTNPINREQRDLIVDDLIEALDTWLVSARRLFRGPVDITLMALGVVLIGFAMWGRILSTTIWAAPEFLGLVVAGAFLFMLAALERIFVRPLPPDPTKVVAPVRAELEKAVESIPSEPPGNQGQ